MQQDLSGIIKNNLLFVSDLSKPGLENVKE